MQILDNGYVELIDSWGSDERIVEGEALSTLLPSDRQLVAQEILKLVKPLPMIIGCDRCAAATIDDFDGWKRPDPEDFDDVTLCPKCQKETDQ